MTLAPRINPPRRDNENTQRHFAVAFFRFRAGARGAKRIAGEEEQFFQEFFLFPRTPFSFQELIEKGYGHPCRKQKQRVSRFCFARRALPPRFRLWRKFYTRQHNVTLRRARTSPLRSAGLFRLVFLPIYAKRRIFAGRFSTGSHPLFPPNLWKTLWKLCKTRLERGFLGCFKIFPLWKTQGAIFLRIFANSPFCTKPKKDGRNGQ